MAAEVILMNLPTGITVTSSKIVYRIATLADLDALVELENACFQQDKLSARSFRRWISADHGILVVAEREQVLVGYGLVWCHRGTRLARLYSLAILDSARGQGAAGTLLRQLEEMTTAKGHFFMRLEVAKTNEQAIRLYARNGYHIFGEHSNYYEDHTDALRMQKQIQYLSSDAISRPTPWYQQTTKFTCGPATLMMAMASLDPQLVLSRELELDIWREATTIFMTSGHGGCHPIGLALAAQRRGFDALVMLNKQQALFVDGVRSLMKREVIELVHMQFVEQANRTGVELCFEDVSQASIRDWVSLGYAVLVLISTYRMDGKKAPHWVIVTGIDDRCMYVHDPDLDQKIRRSIDSQSLPIALEDFGKMSSFGSDRLRCAVVIKSNPGQVFDL